MGRLDYYAPGVYVEEVNRGSRTIQGVNMSVAGFVGFTEDIRGDAELFEPSLITSWTQYLENFSKIGSDGYTNFGAYLPFAVKGWFDNGGGRCWVVSIGTSLPKRSDQTDAETEIEVQDKLVKTSSKRDTLRFRLKDSQHDFGRINVVIDRDEPRQSEDDEEPFDSGEFFKITLAKKDKILDRRVQRDGQEVSEPEVYRHLTMNPEVDSQLGSYVATALAESPYLEVEVVGEAGQPLSRRPMNGRYEVSPPKVTYAANTWYPKMYGSAKRRTGVRGLFEIDDVAMIACPDLMLAFQKQLLTLEQVRSLTEMMVTECENSAPSPAYRMVVLDPPPVKPRQGDTPVAPEEQKPQDVEAWLMESFNRRSQFAALYYPWIKVANPRANGAPISVPPCGHMMGIWCRTDETRGIFKAPANEVPRGVIGLAYDTNFREQELLNPQGINCIRRFRERGTLVWGARTLADPYNEVEWRYISVRRLISYIERSIEMSTQWAVFEPNDEDLWARVTRTISNFLERIWREGGLFGSSPEEAFYVKCDSELNTPETIRLGRLLVEIGVSPVRPAEFVVFRISQWDPTQDKE